LCPAALSVTQTGLEHVAKVSSEMHHKPAFFCSTLVKNEATWFLPEEHKFPGKTPQYFCVDTDSTTQ